MCSSQPAVVNRETYCGCLWICHACSSLTKSALNFCLFSCQRSLVRCAPSWLGVLWQLIMFYKIYVSVDRKSHSSFSIGSMLALKYWDVCPTEHIILSASSPILYEKLLNSFSSTAYKPVIAHFLSLPNSDSTFQLKTAMPITESSLHNTG